MTTLLAVCLFSTETLAVLLLIDLPHMFGAIILYVVLLWFT